MLRAARFADIPALVAMLHVMCASSKFAGAMDVDDAAAKRLLQGLIHKHGQIGEGGSQVNVVEDGGEITGFMIGLLDRVYHLTDRLCANDMFLFVDPARAGALDAGRLIGAYIAWAEAVPNIYQINLSWTDAMVGASRAGAIYEHRGFRECGRIYEKVVG